MKKTYIQPSTAYMVYNKDIMDLPIHNSVGGDQLSNTFYDDEEEESFHKPNKRKSAWDD